MCTKFWGGAIQMIPKLLKWNGYETCQIFISLVRGSRPWQPGETPGPQSSLTALMLVLVHYPDNTFIQHTVSFIYRETGWWIKGHQIKLRGTTSQDQGRSIMKKLWFKLIYYLYNSPFTVQMILQSFSNKSWVQEMIEDTNWLTLPILLPLTSTVFILAK